MLNENEIRMLEFNKLVKMLQKNDIPFEVEQLATGKRLFVPSSFAFSEGECKYRISVICCTGSFGYDRGLLEMWAPSTWQDVDGYLTAEDAYKWISEIVGKEKDKGSEEKKNETD